MKICLVSLNALPALSVEHRLQHAGGAELQLAQLAVILARMGLQVSLVVTDQGQPDGAVYHGVRTLKAYRLGQGLPGLRFVYPVWVKLWSAFRRADADVYLYSCAGMVLGMLALFCRLHGRRLVFRAASDSDCDPATLLIRTRRDRWLYRFGLRRADAVLVQSERQQRAMQANFGRSSVVVRSLIERPLAGQLPAVKDIDVLWVANIRQLKRLDRALALARALDEFRFHIVGGPVPGEEALFDRLAAEAKALPNITFHGKVPYGEVGALFDRARVLINTSEVEGFPNTFLQAWARGIPVVTMFDPDGIVRQHGLGSAHANVEEMTVALRGLLDNGERYAAASRAAHGYMNRRFDEDEVLAPYVTALCGPAGLASAAP